MKAIQLHRDLTRIWEGEPGWRGTLAKVQCFSQALYDAGNTNLIHHFC